MSRMCESRWYSNNHFCCKECSLNYFFLSCHQTAFFHLSTNFLAFSMNFWKSSKEQGCASNGHCNICWCFQELACCVFVEVLPSLTLLLNCCMLHQCITCCDISTLPRDGYAPLLNFHPGWQRSCVVPSYAGVAIHCSGWQGSQQIVWS